MDRIIHNEKGTVVAALQNSRKYYFVSNQFVVEVQLKDTAEYYEAFNL